jgi:hypothetical protein
MFKDKILLNKALDIAWRLIGLFHPAHFKRRTTRVFERLPLDPRKTRSPVSIGGYHVFLRMRRAVGAQTGPGRFRPIPASAASSLVRFLVAGQWIVIGKIAMLLFRPQLCGKHVLERPHELQCSIRNNGVIGGSSLGQELPDSAAPTLKVTWLTLARKCAYCVQTHSANVAFLPCLLNSYNSTNAQIFNSARIATYSRENLVDCFSLVQPQLFL